MWAVARFMPGLSVHFPYQQILVVGFVLVGIAIGASAIGLFLRSRTTISPHALDKTNTLVVGGIYCLTRNPMYLGLLLVLIGWGVRLGNPLNIIVLAGFVIAINALQIKPEEKILREKFGADFDAYCARVRRWL